jgi:hypothetical protein
MNPAYLHLLVNHLPVAGALVASILLAVAAVRRTTEGAVYGYVALIAVALLAIVAYVTGNFAPPVLAHIAGATPDRITYHQVSAIVALIVAILIGLTAAIPLILTGIATRRGVLIAYLILALILDGLFAFVAHTGGVIRHTEIR